MLRRLFACVLAMTALAIAMPPAIAADAAFPFGSELMLDGKPMRGTKRLPMMQIEQGGAASIDLWCGSLSAQADVGGGTIAITPGARDNGQCDPDRVAGDDALLDTLAHMTSWRRRGDTIELSGPATTLRFHLMTN
jgi:heat shock protein HslJ